MVGVSAHAAAAQLLPAWQAPHQIAAIEAIVRPQTRGEGYAVQQALLAATGDKAMGWKIAATSTAGQQHIGVSGPLAGRLLASRCLPDGAAVSMRGNVMQVIEAEFAFRMGADVLAQGATPLTLQHVMAQVADLHLAIEIPNSRYQDFVTAGEAQLIADFACASHMVLGAALTTDWRGVDLAAQAVQVNRGGEVVALGKGSNALGDPRVALTWLANELISHGMHLQAGDAVITGTCVVPVPVLVGQHLTAQYPGLGEVSVAIAA
ncbi:MAG: hydratase [Betaproteobacteria bacterium]|nr:hydratase [Betaproteobacteria bacterium]